MPFIAMSQWYEKYINIPYKLFGENPESGMDCYTLLRYILKQEKEIIIPYTSSDFLKLVDDQWYQKVHVQYFLDASKNGDWVEVATLKPFDFIAMSLGSTNVVNHVAMYVGNNNILHMLENRPSSVHHYHKYFQQYTIKKVRWKSLVS